MSEISENLRDLIIFQDSNKFEPLLNNIRKTLDAFKISKFRGELIGQTGGGEGVEPAATYAPFSKRINYNRGLPL